jgi:octaheme c-type cytochrome (tetrathionate reductase family)
MKNRKPFWILGLVGIVIVITVPVAYFWPQNNKPLDDPWAHVPTQTSHVDHTHIITGPFENGQEVTRACLECHEDAGEQVMVTSHFTWESTPFNVPWRDEPVTIGKKNQINNFCIGTQGNQKKCTTCHVGYGWGDTSYDFNNPENVDCLACHADTATYAKGEYGLPADGIDLVAAAQSVREPTRDNCGKCHFDGGGGNGVKHGDLDESLYFPTENLDVHMGRLDFQFTDCHQTTDHQIKGRMVADNYTIDPDEQVACTDCHNAVQHQDERINAHVESIACQTCHIPAIALEDPTKVTWDWSTAGQDLAEDHYTYLKIKGTFTYEKDYRPTYIWFNGNLAYRYLLGDKMNPSEPTMIDLPAGDIKDSNAKIFPFKVHVAKQPYDTVNNILLQPRTGGNAVASGGFWETFDWPSALELGAQDANLDYSGQFGFAETWMYWPTTHMVQPKESALGCDDCHGEDGRMDWEALGYPGDPIEWGGRFDKQ